MLVVYDTLTKNCERFSNKLPKNKFDTCHIKEYDGFSNFILITYTINFGKIPKTTEDFLSKYSDKMLGICSSGNKNWGAYFGIAGNKISTKYGVPLISKFELQGTNLDVDNFLRRVEELYE